MFTIVLAQTVQITQAMAGALPDTTPDGTAPPSTRNPPKAPRAGAKNDNP